MPPEGTASSTIRFEPAGIVALIGTLTVPGFDPLSSSASGMVTELSVWMAVMSAAFSVALPTVPLYVPTVSVAVGADLASSTWNVTLVTWNAVVTPKLASENTR